MDETKDTIIELMNLEEDCVLLDSDNNIIVNPEGFTIKSYVQGKMTIGNTRLYVGYGQSQSLHVSNTTIRPASSQSESGMVVKPSQTSTAVEPSQTGTAVKPSQTGTAVEPSQTGTAVKPLQTGTHTITLYAKDLFAAEDGDCK